MSNKLDDLSERIAGCVLSERQTRGWSLAELADRSGVSKAMVSKVERGESSPTTAVLGRLCGAFGMTLSTFLTRAEAPQGRLVRAAEQPTWTDQETGAVRTLLSPSAGGPIELVAVDLPPGAEVRFPAAMYQSFKQTTWVIAGRLTLIEGATAHLMEAGDCIELGLPADCTFRNDADQPCRYLAAAAPRDVR